MSDRSEIDETQVLRVEIDQLRSRETAIREILGTIARSPNDERPVFDVILENAARLCDAPMARLLMANDERTHFSIAASWGDALRVTEIGDLVELDPVIVPARSILENTMLHIPDMREGGGYKAGLPIPRRMGDVEGIRTLLLVPLSQGDTALGCIALNRREILPFTDDDISLVQSFAAQAVIAIENVRKFRELQTRLEREAASKEILQVINRSREDEQPVFDTILESARRLCDAPFAGIALCNEDRTFMHVAAWSGANTAYYQFMQENPIPLIEGYSVSGDTVLNGEAAYFDDLTASKQRRDGNRHSTAAAEMEAIRTFVVVPLMVSGTAIGCLWVYRQEVLPFTDAQIALVETFADQAVIAIENTRQFRELQTRLEHEAATRELLSIISQSRDDETLVFEMIVRSAGRLCGSPGTTLMLVDEARENLVHRAGWDEDKGQVGGATLPLTDPGVAPVAVRECRIVHDVNIADSDLYHQGHKNRRRLVEELGVHTLLSVPIYVGGEAIGCINLGRREPGPFTDQQIALVEAFAAQAVIAIENARQFRELQTRLEREAATREILSIISQHQDDEQPVFDVILKNAATLCQSSNAVLVLVDDALDEIVLRAAWGEPYSDISIGASVPRTGDAVPALAMREKRAVQIEDLADTDLYRDGWEFRRKMVDQEGVRTILSVPLIAGSRTIGCINLRRKEVHPFSPDLIALLETFAAQAVIAIENVRQFRELQTRLEREAATREILSVISQSPDDEQPVFDTILENAARLCGSPQVLLGLFDESNGRLAVRGSLGASDELVERYNQIGMSLDDTHYPSIRAIRDCKPLQVEDARATDLYRDGDEIRKASVDVEGIRTFLTIPLVSAGRGIGGIALFRHEVRPFAADQIALLETFAAQAVIAIENVRQFRELQTRLEREAATGQILSVISQSPDDEQPVFDVIVENAARLCNAPMARLLIANDERTGFKIAAGWGIELQAVSVGDYMDLDPDLLPARVILENQVINLPDMRDGENYKSGLPVAVRMVEEEGIRTLLMVPLSRGSQAIGAFVVNKREVAPFTEDEVELVKTFAAQAVIAIENVRQFRELQTRLEREAATGQILSVISQSQEDARPVFDVILENAARLCGASMARLLTVNDERTRYQVAASWGDRLRVTKVGDSYDHDGKLSPSRSIQTNSVIHLPDLTESPFYIAGHPAVTRLADEEGIRSVLYVPLSRGDTSVGCIALRTDGRLRPLPTRRDRPRRDVSPPRPSSPLENARQFRELQTRLEREAATREILSVISQSPDDEQPVFDVIVENAARLCGTHHAGLILVDENRENVVLAAMRSTDYIGLSVGDTVPLEGGSATSAGCIFEARVVHFEDLANDDLYKQGDPHRRLMVDKAGARSLLNVPLILGRQAIGAISLQRNEVKPFTPDEISLVESFAAQAVIAIENVRQFRAIQAANTNLS